MNKKNYSATSITIAILTIVLLQLPASAAEKTAPPQKTTVKKHIKGKPSNNSNLLFKAVKIKSRANKDIYNFIINTSKAAAAFNKAGKQEKALALLRKVLETEALYKEDMMAGTLRDIGKLLFALGRLEKSLESFNDALDIDTRQQHTQQIAVDYKHIGIIQFKKGRFRAAVKSLTASLELLPENADKKEAVVIRRNLANALLASGNFSRADRYYRQGLKIALQPEGSGGLDTIDKTTLNDMKNDIAFFNGMIGYIAYINNDLDNALVYLERALSLNRKLHNKSWTAKNLDLIGFIYRQQNKTMPAIEALTEAMQLNREVGRRMFTAKDNASLAALFESIEEYDKAIFHYKSAVSLYVRLEQGEEIADNLEQLGIVFFKVGKYRYSLHAMQTALEMNGGLGRTSKVAKDIEHIANANFALGLYDDTLEFLKRAYAIFNEQGTVNDISRIFNSIGNLYLASGNLDEAFNYYSKAYSLDSSEQDGKEANAEGAARDLNNIATVYYKRHEYPKAVEFFNSALKRDEKNNNHEAIASTLGSLGVIYFNTSASGGSITAYERAIDYFIRSAETYYGLRQKAGRITRRNYLSNEVAIYNYLALGLARSGRSDTALQAAGFKSAAILSDRVDRLDLKNTVADPETVYRTIGTDTAMITWSNTDWNNILSFAATNRFIKSKEVTAAETLSPFLEKNRKHIRKLNVEATGPVSNEETGSIISSPGSELETIVKYYLALLRFGGKGKRTRETANLLYHLLIEPVEPMIAGKSELVIVPDGILEQLPFEALLDDDGKYLVEKYKIRYFHSVSAMVKQHNKQLPHTDNGIIAFGGAVYNPKSYDKDMHSASYKELRSASKKTILDKKNRVGKWSNLPHTLDEVQKLHDAFSGTKIITGDKNSESKLYHLSESGALANYSIVHFANHLYLDKDNTINSGLVFSVPAANNQQGEGGSPEDGIVRLNEMNRLKFAGTVVVSTGETGLARSFMDRFVPMESAAFVESLMNAGATGVILSHWMVKDRSTAIFMKELYKRILTQSMNYPDALAGLKRMFIKGKFGKRYRNPYYWAPYIYYGQ